MIASILLAVALAQPAPCLNPPVRHTHHKRTLPGITPVELGCKVLPVAAQDTIEPVFIEPHNYYPAAAPQICYQESPSSPAEFIGPVEGYYPPPVWLGTYGGGTLVAPPVRTVTPIAPPFKTTPVVVYYPPVGVVGTHPITPTKAPEIDTGAGLSAVTLLAGALIVIRGRRRFRH